ncbi:MAG: hypothetical protein V7746_01770 [Halioglobus sp.]
MKNIRVFAYTGLLAMAALLAGCSTEATQGAKQGAASGAAVGAVGGMVTALVFGGDIADGAARGAVWGGSTGAASGAIQGEQVAKQKRSVEQQKKAKELEKLQKEIGTDAYRGLEALADCNHTVAKAYAETAQGNSKKNYALAGYWLEIMTVAEMGNKKEAQSMLPELVKVDSKVKTTQQANKLLGEVLVELGQIREDNGMRRNCD